MTIFLFPKTKNETEGKTVQHYFRHPEDFNQDYFDHLKEKLLAEFSKIIRPL